MLLLTTWPMQACVQGLSYEACTSLVAGRARGEPQRLCTSAVGPPLSHATMACDYVFTADVQRCTPAALQCAHAPAGVGHETATFFRCTRTRGGRANRSPGAHAAGATRPGAARARANPAGGMGWTCAGAGAVCACDLGQILMIFYRKGFRVRAGRFQTCQIFRIDYWQKDMRNGPYFNTRQRP